LGTSGHILKRKLNFRRYFGHKRTIRPNAKKLYSLFLNRTSMSWETFSSKVQTLQKGFMGEPNEIKPGRGEFHEHPMDCICAKTKGRSGHSKPHPSNRIGEAMEKRANDGEFDWRDLDYGENTPLGRDSSNETDSDMHELEDMVSD
jgi:hypothetical protein